MSITEDIELLEKKITTLGDAGLVVDQSDHDKLARLKGQASTGAGAQVAAVVATGADGMIEVALNKESFESGGQGAIPPENVGIYQGVCTGWAFGRKNGVENRDQIFIGFKSLENAAESWRGDLSCSNLNKKERSGSWALR